MRVQLKGSDTVVHTRWISVYTDLERTLHWVHVVCFFPLAPACYSMFGPFLKALAQGVSGQLIRLVRRIFAVIFGLMPITYLILQPRRLAMNLKELATWCKEDPERARAAVLCYLDGKHEAMLPNHASTRVSDSTQA